MKRMLLAGAAAVCLFNAAFAADLPVVEEVVEVVAPYDWTGFYLGLQAGYGWSQVDTSFSNGVPNLSPDGNGFVGGAHAGYLWQWDSFVAGPEVDIEYSDVSGSDRSFAGGTSASNADINWMASLRLRAGFAWDRALIYATGGLAYADFDGSGGPAGGPLQSFSDDTWGWTLGAGVDYAIAEHWSARLEYRYTDFDDVGSGLAPLYPAVRVSDDINLHAVRLGVSYNF